VLPAVRRCPQAGPGASAAQPAGKLPTVGATKALRLKPYCRAAGHQGSGHGVYSAVALSRLACMFVAGGVVFVPIVRYN